MTTLYAAREELFEKVNGGKRVTCPCCDKSAAYYSKYLCWASCAILEWLDQQSDWAKPSDLSHRTGSGAALLRHWGLAVSKVPVSKGRGGDSGLWKITELGRQFVKGQISMPESVRIYNGKALGEPCGKLVTFNEARQRNYLDEQAENQS